MSWKGYSAWRLMKWTGLSILIFFSISFLTILFQLYSPLNRSGHFYGISIGFPFEFYYELMIDCPESNHGWKSMNLIWDSLMVWVLTIGAGMIKWKK